MNSETHQRLIAERRAKVRHLVVEGWSERRIAKRLNVSRSTVWNDKQALKAGIW